MYKSESFRISKSYHTKLFMIFNIFRHSLFVVSKKFIQGHSDDWTVF